MPLLHHLFGTSPNAGSDSILDPGRGLTPALPRPDPPICLVGDLHGMAALLEAMLARIAAQSGIQSGIQSGAAAQSGAARLIFVGDLIDRGPDSAAVLARVRALCQANPDRVICLMGNHERMLLDFLAEPETGGARWLRSGGGETLVSFGVTGHLRRMNPATRLTELAAALRAALPAGTEAWLRALPLYWQSGGTSGGLAVVHADADPALPMAAQLAKTLLWGMGRASKPRPDGLWLAHGHVIVPGLRVVPGRISLDTGACRYGRLSALWLDGQGAQVLEVATPL